MKVILLTELKGRGGEGDVIEVSRGFANNFLFPKKIALQATPGNLKQLEQRLHNIKKREDIRLAEAGDFRGVLDGKKITITVKVGEAGRLFGSVTAHMIAEAITEQLGIDVDRRKIETHGVIKTVGEHDAEVSVYRDIKAHLAVVVVAEGAAVEVSEEEAALAAEIEAAQSGEESVDAADAEGAEGAAGAESAESVEALPTEEPVDAPTPEPEPEPVEEAPSVDDLPVEEEPADDPATEPAE